MTDFTMKTDSDGVATITWDVPDAKMNVLSRAGYKDLSDLITQAIDDDAIKGVIITSGKADFAGGMDLNVLAALRDEAGENPAEALFNFTMDGHKVLRKMERAGMDPKTNKGGKPVACAIPGTCAGIGTEIALATHRRFIADNPKARMGLPEIKVGLFPGGGGATRVSRMVGAMASAPTLLEGKMYDVKGAKSAGLVDEIVPGDELLSRAKEWVLGAKDADIVKPWDEKGWKMPGGAPYHPAGFMTFVGASAMVHAQTQGVYPAAKALLSAIYEGAQVPFDTALKIEARWFTSILMNPTSSAMIRSLFINKGALEKGANRPKVDDQRVTKLGVLGAGMMGAGIAYVSANAGIEVVLIDQDQQAADRGKSYSETILDKGIKRKKVSEDKKAEVLSRIHATTDYAMLEGCDLIVEAVFEDTKVKADVTKLAQAHIDQDCIFATNTSTLPITELAKASHDPQKFIGIHFFSPVDKMLLVEIIKGKETGDIAVAKALDFVRQIRKTPIVVNDERFFYANRCIIPYINEGIRMVGEGVSPALIENAAKGVGMPLGPLQLVDETSVDLGVKIAKATRTAMGPSYPDDAVDEVLFWMFDQKRMGRKSAAGFYAYDEKGKRQELWKGLTEKYKPAQTQPSVREVQNRLLLAQVLEAIRAKEAGVLEDIREGDVGAILGWGFAPWSGGPFSWVDMMSAQQILTIAQELETTHGARFAPPELLKEMAKSGATFYETKPKAA